MSVLQVNSESFEQEVMKTSLMVLVDFYAPWCGHCSRLAPILDEIAAEYQDKVKVVKINVDENHELATQTYGVMGLPTMIFIHEGKVVDKLIGFNPKQKIVEKFMQYSKE